MQLSPTDTDLVLLFIHARYTQTTTYVYPPQQKVSFVTYNNTCVLLTQHLFLNYKYKILFQSQAEKKNKELYIALNDETF